MRLIALVALFATGCSGMASDDAGQEADDGDASGGDTGAADGSIDTGAEPEWWRLEADLELVDGLPVAESSVLRLSVLLGTDCVDEVVPMSVVAVEELPHETIYTWWELALPEDGWVCLGVDEGPRPGPLLVGIGAMHPEVQAVLGSMTDVQGDAAESLNGAYAQLPGSDQLLVFGAAGPADAWTGDGVASTGAPLADGTWWVRTAYSFPMAVSSSPTAATSPERSQ